MHSDLLEKITEDYFKQKGYFTSHNIPYSLSKQTSSDIDVIGIHPSKKDISRVVVVSCKSWDKGLDLKKILEISKNPPIERIKSGLFRTERFREIIYKEWIDALKDEVERLTGTRMFTFYFSAVKFTHEDLQEEFILFCKNKLIDCDVKLLPFRQIISEMQTAIFSNTSKKPLESEISRTLQLIQSADLEIRIRGS